MERKARSIESREGDIREEETKGIRRKNLECREEGCRYLTKVTKAQMKIPTSEGRL